MSLDTAHQREFGGEAYASCVERKVFFVMVDLPGKFYP